MTTEYFWDTDMKIYYISPSEIPSRSANSIHVILQTHALNSIGNSVTLFCKRTIRDSSEFRQAVDDGYGLSFREINIISYFSKSSTATNIKIMLLFLLYFFKNPIPDLIISRNLYASFVLAVILRKRIFFETHQLEFGLKKFMQKSIIRSNSVTTILISGQLLKFIRNHLEIENFNHIILPDAAKEGIKPISPHRKKELLDDVTGHQNWDLVCSYFGAIHEGRGVEVIYEMAHKRPKVLFLIYGGTKTECDDLNDLSTLNNLKHYPHISHKEALDRMQVADILLMPYQRKLSVGEDGKGSNTSDWMSPMKMFDYLASGVPIISSDLKSLREILKHKHNSILVEPTDSDSWAEALDMLSSDSNLYDTVAKNAYLDYKTKYTWNIRAENIIKKSKSI
tara:strand:+ start:3023 stop:4207 length:1185 start_codon:yes stop_codon:yes gene_type:complete